MKNEKDVLVDIQALKAVGASLRRIAVIYGIPLTYGDIWRILHGKFPKGIAKRAALHLSPICPSCHRKVSRPVTVNQLMQLPLQKMPPEILHLAYENRKEML